MSGGSFNYLCYKDIDELMQHKDLLEEMATRLIELGFKDVAKETLKLKYILEQTETRLETHKERLENMWRSVEWYDSGDHGFEQIEEAYTKYKEE